MDYEPNDKLLWPRPRHPPGLSQLGRSGTLFDHHLFHHFLRLGQGGFSQYSLALFACARIMVNILKRSKGGWRPTERSVFKFFFESWLFYRQDFGFLNLKRQTKKGMKIVALAGRWLSQKVGANQVSRRPIWHFWVSADTDIIGRPPIPIPIRWQLKE